MPQRITNDAFHEIAGDLPSYTRDFPDITQQPEDPGSTAEEDWLQQVSTDVKQVTQKVESLKNGEGLAAASEKMKRRLERKALRLVLKDLREKGASDQFLQKHMFTIKERIHDFLYHTNDK